MFFKSFFVFVTVLRCVFLSTRAGEVGPRLPPFSFCYYLLKITPMTGPLNKIDTKSQVSSLVWNKEHKKGDHRRPRLLAEPALDLVVPDPQQGCRPHRAPGPHPLDGGVPGRPDSRLGRR